MSLEYGRPGAFEPGTTIARLSVAALALVLVIITAAAFLRMTQAGLGCPDWPACYGRIEANATRAQQAAPGAAVRLAHRIAALSAGALVLAIGWLILSRRPRRPGELAVLGALLALLVFLAVIGRWSGISLIPAVALGNILGGSLLLALLWFLWHMQRPGVSAPARPAAALLAWAALLAFALQSSAGALVSAKYAALACGAWFSCPGASAAHGLSVFNPFTPLALGPDGAVEQAVGLATLQLAHHFGAAAVLLLALALGAALLRDAGSRLTGIIVMVGAGVQVALGAAAAAFDHALTLSIAHNVMANLLLLALVSAAHETSRGSLCRGTPGCP
jgi:cytochrome c oxidase assembly protein subunit 15